MKHNLLLFILLLSFSAQGQRHRPAGDLSVISQQPVVVAIDNRIYQMAGTDFTIGNVPAGKRKIELYTWNNTRNRRGALLYEGFVKLEPGQRLIGTWDARRRLFTMSTAERNYLDYNDGYEQDGTPYPGGPGNGYEPQEPGYPGNNAYPALPAGYSYLSPQQLQDIGVLTERLVSDKSKVDNLKQLLSRRAVTVDQVAEMTGWLSFDNSRLDFLKWAYNNTLDKDNYPRLYRLLTFDNSIRQLTNYIYKQQ